MFKIKRLIQKNNKWLLFCIILCGIFWFSKQDGISSDRMSQKCNDILLKIAETLHCREVVQRVLFYIDIRKIAHVILFLAEGLSSWYIVRICNKKIKLLMCIAIGVLLGVLDEIHQLFVSGRTSTVTDIVIDIAGAFLGVLIAILIQWIQGKVRGRIWRRKE